MCVFYLISFFPCSYFCFLCLLLLLEINVNTDKMSYGMYMYHLTFVYTVCIGSSPLRTRKVLALCMMGSFSYFCYRLLTFQKKNLRTRNVNS